MLKKILMLSTLALMAMSITGCANDSFRSKDLSFSYYERLKSTPAKHLYVYGGDLEFKDLFLGEAIQGLFSRNDAKFYYSDGKCYEYWLKDLKENYGFTYEPITIDEMILEYANSFKENSSYILYDPLNNESINAATTLCGIFDAIPAVIDDVDKLEKLNIKLAIDARKLTEKEVFYRYKDKINNSGAVQQKGTIPHLRDYSIACKYLCFYPDSVSQATIKFRGDVHNFIKKDAPVFGWGPFNEDSHIQIATQGGQFTIPSDYCYNMSLLASEGLTDKKEFKQPNRKKELVADPSKHYVCITRSDGDNVQTWYNYFPFSDKDLLSKRSNFPMGWTIQPSLVDLAPTILDNVYKNADINDHFVCGVSGQGYIFPQIYPAMKSFTEGLSPYLRKADLSIIQILDSAFNNDVIEAYSQIPEVSGGMYLIGNKYEAGKGKIVFSKNGKPFVACRHSLWNADPIGIANEINSYPANIKSEDGYTFINLHPWSMSYEDACTMVEAFDSDVMVVSPGDFIDLIKENVEK